MEILNVNKTQHGSFQVMLAGGGELTVPDDSSNRHYLEIQEWVSAGGVVTEFSLTEEQLDVRVRQAIRGEGMKRLSEFMEDADFEIGASLYLLYIRTGRQWNAGEQAVVDDIQPKFTYIKDLYLAVKQAIANIPNLTIEQKENFNVATDVVWPLPPA